MFLYNRRHGFHSLVLLRAEGNRNSRSDTVHQWESGNAGVGINASYLSRMNKSHPGEKK